MRLATVVSTLAFFCTLTLASTTGKIAGTVKDSKTGENLIGVNIQIEGTTMGAATNTDGYYVILNVPPGTYSLKASYVGYAFVTISDVQVSIDQTTTLDISMTEASVQAKEVVIVAQRPEVQKDVSASTVNLAPTEIASLPTVSVNNVVALQAGVQISSQGQILIRGISNSTVSNADQVAFMVDGFTLRNERDNSQYNNISMTSVQDIQIQTGGFAAQYGNIRSGIVNVTTQSGSKEHYTVSVISRMAPPQWQDFSGPLNSTDFYYVRPYMDPAVAYTGTTNGAWSTLMQSQYPTFDGWIAESQKTLASGDSTKFLSPTAAQKLWEWQHRKDFSIVKPNYNVDASIGGPFPVVSKDLGDLRFWGSYVSQQSMYMIPLSTDAYRNYNGSLKLTSDVGPGMKLIVEGMLGRQTGTSSSNAGQPGIFQSSSAMSSVLSEVSYIDARMFTPEYWAPTRVDFNMFGLKFSHAISQSTFYQVDIRETGSRYHTNPGAVRDTASIYQFGNYYYTDEAPEGFWPYPSSAIDGMRMSVGMSTSRDSSKVYTYNAKFDLTSQIDQYNQIQTGAEFTLTDNNVNYAIVDTYLPTGTSWSHWHTFPKRASAYLQDKIEFQGMVANLGVRIDDSYAGGQWYSVNSPYSVIFSGSDLIGLDTVSSKPTKNIVVVEPRLGISFPITVTSKLYFNYGHFYSMPSPDNLYLIRRLTGTNNVSVVADPNAPLPRTIAYELGFEQSLFDEYLIHLAGYYKDVSDERTTTTYVSADSKVHYALYTGNLYEDIRGFEATISKNRGDWFRAFVDYTYMVSTYGQFGYSFQYQSPSDQRQYELNNYTDLYQTKPLPQPNARLNLDFFTPDDYGPTWGGFQPIGAWHLNLLGTWQAGSWFTWAGGGSIPGIQNNVEWADYVNFDLRVSKNLDLAGINLNLFADIYNVFDIKYMSPNYGFIDALDFNAYMESLHLPASIAGDAANPKLGYVNTPGNDKPGDYQSASKPWIRMPKLWQLAFLNPRTFYFGIKLTYNLPS